MLPEASLVRCPSAYFVQMYRYLQQGFLNAEAMRPLGVNGEPLITWLSEHQQRQLKGRLRHPFFWSGIQLMGAHW